MKFSSFVTNVEVQGVALKLKQARDTATSLVVQAVTVQYNLFLQ